MADTPVNGNVSQDLPFKQQTQDVYKAPPASYVYSPANPNNYVSRDPTPPPKTTLAIPQLPPPVNAVVQDIPNVGITGTVKNCLSRFRVKRTTYANLNTNDTIIPENTSRIKVVVANTQSGLIIDTVPAVGGTPTGISIPLNAPLFTLDVDQHGPLAQMQWYATSATQNITIWEIIPID